MISDSTPDFILWECLQEHPGPTTESALFELAAEFHDKGSECKLFCITILIPGNSVHSTLKELY